MESKTGTLLEQYATIRSGLSDDQRMERLELVCLTVAQQVDELVTRHDAALTRLETVLERVEKEGPAALLGSVLGGGMLRRRGR